MRSKLLAQLSTLLLIEQLKNHPECWEDLDLSCRSRGLGPWLVQFWILDFWVQARPINSLAISSSPWFREKPLQIINSKSPVLKALELFGFKVLTKFQGVAQSKIHSFPAWIYVWMPHLSAPDSEFQKMETFSFIGKWRCFCTFAQQNDLWKSRSTCLWGKFLPGPSS